MRSRGVAVATARHQASVGIMPCRMADGLLALQIIHLSPALILDRAAKLNYYRRLSLASTRLVIEAYQCG